MDAGCLDDAEKKDGAVNAVNAEKDALIILEERGNPGCCDCRRGCLDDAEKQEGTQDDVKAEDDALLML